VAGDAPGGRLSHRIATAVKVGDVVRVSGSMGTSISAGASIRAIAVHRRGERPGARSNPSPRLHSPPAWPARALYFGVRAERDVYFERELAGLQERHANFRAQIVFRPRRTSSSHTPAAQVRARDRSGWRRISRALGGFKA